MRNMMFAETYEIFSKLILLNFSMKKHKLVVVVRTVPEDIIYNIDDMITETDRCNVGLLAGRHGST